MTHEGLARELREYARKADKLRDGWTLYIRAAAAIEILDRLCDGYEAENERLRKSADVYKEAAEVFRRKAYEEQKQRETLEVENQKVKDERAMYKAEAEAPTEAEKALGFKGGHVTMTELFLQSRLLEEMNEKLKGDIGEISSRYKALQAEKEKSDRRFAEIETDLTALMRHSGEGCEICAHAVKEQRGDFIQYRCALGGGVDCRPGWRGNKREAE